MGKAMRWFKAVLGMKRAKDMEDSILISTVSDDKKEKNRWSFSKSGKVRMRQPLMIASNKGLLSDFDIERRRSGPGDDDQQNERAIAVAVASAAAADAAVAAAHAAAVVVRLAGTGRGPSFYNGGIGEIFAALKIQSVFRGFLARKALRALKGIVKLQALVRGYLVRKRTAATFLSMQSLIRAQTTVRSQRAHHLRSHNKENKPTKSSNDHFKWLPEIENPKIVEIDSFKIKARSRSRKFNNQLSEFVQHRPCYSTMASPARFPPNPTPNCRNVQELSDLYFNGEEFRASSTSHNTPRLMNSRWGSTPPPVKSDYYECGERNYMAKTESFKAKLRSRSAPRSRSALNEIMGPRNSMCSVRMLKSCNGVEEEEDDDDDDDVDYDGNVFNFSENFSKI